ncbi:circularly permuted type 2 ATP-grasp protein [Arsukibacterium sp.]|uniref:circularly permuted type 2 ATP-grasp protein n=1 Tax=Arsukibacterium sp. TaxID=1977258 RepID=UPI00299D03A4|nr:circularly permuted type 2 ATP-grasp protein [Arsukibacterium sp.]MDX1536173.1 circularly permuted type 2 ATP-grasp protein [Arsukibacterium sp.]
MSFNPAQPDRSEQQHWQTLPQWQTMQQWWQQQSESGLNQLYNELQHQLRENGAAVDPWHSSARQLDLQPWLIAAEQWQQLEAGLSQRHKLLNAMLADLYGPQTLLQQGIIPADVIHLNAAFLLPCADLTVSQAWLSLYACDIGRDSHGRFCVFNDVSRAPAGLGHVLEHRLAFNNTTTELNSQIKKSQLAGFFRQLQQLLQQPDQSGQQQHLAALLTHQQRDTAYFEHAFLANYLDIALVHGADLMLKSGKLWLKTLSGLQPVQSVLRYLDDNNCDPLELAAGSSGCAGLLQGIRQGQLLCANLPGSALLESGALLPFMAQACQFLLAEPLQLASVDTLWCGEDDALARLQQQPEHYCVQHLISNQQFILSQLDDEALATLWQQVKQHPQAYIARAILPLSQLPCRTDTGSSELQTGALRLFSLLDHQQTISVLPGALGRTDRSPLVLQTMLQQGFNQQFNAKDVWVLADKNLSNSLLQSASNSITLSRQAGLLSSRVADHLFWLGRYNERLNLICRALRAALPLLNDEDPARGQQDARALLQFCLQANGAEPDPNASIELLLEPLFSASNPQGLVAILKNLLFNAQSVREYFGEDTWYVLDKLQSAVYRWPAQPDWQQPALLLRTLDEIILLQTAIYGINSETMTRTHSLRFMDLGQHLERALQTCGLLHSVFCQTSASASLLEALLRMADTLLTYRRRYHNALHPVPIIDLLLLDDSTPRSVAYQCTVLVHQIKKLPPQQNSAPGSQLPGNESQLSSELLALLQQTDPQQLFDQALQPQLELSHLLLQLQLRLRQLSDSITLSYFSHIDTHNQWQRF